MAAPTAADYNAPESVEEITGYGVTLPSSIEWSTRLYPQNRRPVALIN
jgi:hypothetical protein